MWWKRNKDKKKKIDEDKREIKLKKMVEYSVKKKVEERKRVRKKWEMIEKKRGLVKSGAPIFWWSLNIALFGKTHECKECEC